MMDLAGKRVFITGGAQGLGYALATKLVAEGAEVLIGDRDEGLAQSAAQQIGCSALLCDVTLIEELQAAADWMQTNWGGVDIVVNNAGVAQMGDLANTSIEDWQWTLDINVIGMVRSTKVFAPVMAAQGQGYFLNVASMASFLYMSGGAAYSASKAAAAAFSETMMLELERDGIGVSVLCPAFFRTNLAQNMRASDAKSEAVTVRLVERARVSAEDIANMAIAGMKRRAPYIFTHKAAIRTWRMKRFLPFKIFLNRMRAEMRRIETRMARKAAAKAAQDG